MFVALCDVAWTVDGAGALVCTGTLSIADYPTAFDMSTLDPIILTEAFASGVALIVTAAVIGVAINTILKLIRSL